MLVQNNLFIKTQIEMNAIWKPVIMKKKDLKSPEIKMTI